MAAAMLTVVLMLSLGSAAFSGTWNEVHDDVWEYYYGNGTKAESAWIDSNGKWYFIDSYGTMMTDGVTPDGYIVGKDGVWTGEKLDYLDGLDNTSRAAYTAVIKMLSEPCDYNLFDITGDNRPEMFLKCGTCEADYVYNVYTISGNEAKLIGGISGGHSGFETDRNGRLYLRWGHMGSAAISIVTYSNGEVGLTELARHEFTGHFTDDYGDVDKAEKEAGIMYLSSFSVEDITSKNRIINPLYYSPIV